MQYFVKLLGRISFKNCFICQIILLQYEINENSKIYFIKTKSYILKNKYSEYNQSKI